MGKIAFLFSGQGAQKAGMGMDFHSANPRARALFDYAETVRPGVIRLCAEGTPDALARTENTQPAVYLADLAAAMAFQDASGIFPDGVAGFSLGELAALAFAGAYTPEEGFRLVCERGRVMAAAARENPASMAAVLKLPARQVAELCRACGAYAVNFNSAEQTVAAGSVQALEMLAGCVRDAGGRLITLAVGGGFHSPFMENASSEFRAILRGFAVGAPKIPVYANETALPYGDCVATGLSHQLSRPVLWERTIQNMARDGFTTFVETGVGVTLAKLVTRILPSAKVLSVEDAKSLERALKEM
ncbi:MAG: ACP S-malonyltransferase [Clostridiaceae bacterium]|nr:ACP S-malonyltransferase [Clostridiaceae bacterium]